MAEREISEGAMARNKTDEESDEEEGPPTCKIKLSELRSHLDYLITFIDSSSDPEVKMYYSHFGAFRVIIIPKHKTYKI
jgi:hypothetical protein